MAISRRTLVTSALWGAALGAVSTAEVLQTPTRPAAAASPPGDVVGKITVGYQGWFACAGDGAPIGGWWHWSANWSQLPSPSNTAIVAWPDVRDFTRTYPTGYANFGNGQPATLFSSYDQQTVDTHFQWMQQHGCDTAALQRFNPYSSEGPTRDAMAAKVRAAAESLGRKYYIMYDVTGWTSMQSEIKTDWANKMSAHTASPAYARQNGKPVVGIWGFGFNDDNHPWSPAACLDVVNWFKSQGCYVMGGVPTYWRTGVNDSRPGYLDVYHAFNMISPWMVGRIGDAAGSDWFYTNVNTGDQADCTANGIDYQPCVLPGDVSARQRAHGDFMWRQFYNMVRLGAQGIYISMFDEFNEGNQIAKTAETQAMVPANSGLLALDEDGTPCSSDYYLRLSADGGRMLKGQLALTPVRPTPPLLTGNGPTDLARGKPTAESGHTQALASANAVDGDPNSYWESPNNAFPQWWQVDLGTTATISRLVLRLPPATAWAARTQTLSILGSGDGATFTTIVGPADYRFDPATGNTVTVTLPTTTTRYVRLNFTTNTGWPAGQLSQVEVYGTSSGGDTQAPTTPGNLTATGHTSTSVSLAWSASTDNVGVAGYQVRQSGAVVATTSATSYTVSGLNPGTAYTFTVTAQDAAGNVSPASNAVTQTTDPAANTNLARGKPTSESGHNQVYESGKAVDGDANTYWESVNSAFPQWWQVDLGSATGISRLVMKLPPPSAWATRTETLSILGSTDGSAFDTIVGSTGYTFNPATGNTVTVTFANTIVRYVRLNVTANSGWPAGQLSEVEIYSA
ncbi:discoidin domain-containing protein [Micromonospora sp. NPDC047548]|uniref:galactose-binding domain-containing protein n=1 Tax=Micromonospora sp. NPDC047548 TaxID=3155624 RepID=UPI0034087D7F